MEIVKVQREKITEAGKWAKEFVETRDVHIDYIRLLIQQIYRRGRKIPVYSEGKHKFTRLF